MEARCCRSTKSLTDFGLGLLLIAVLGTDLGTEQAETNLNRPGESGDSLI
ncbi:Uncharacterised protein [Mycobacterium tuberculosis]|uniref:Uncharacterized protein n=1 Tax=Mycobacterium tuberculosis TaxID=1773 RepID=A0A655AR78_MYCTX|nr:Uncharacterised protein [Mycobacterium tuberculosis]CKR96304.1 Uncharacterised protein [Mycobacterium tuberculosis]CKS67228.1 Uncharacterised protein [Mycobacterium tuberculosis]CKU12075.1 Uncharacterised protein [Mycobacterium tuberculosis]CKU14749.1 Uncharacterised protein [Mycobacterium tuberculosis]